MNTGRLSLVIAILLGAVHTAAAVDRVVLKRNGKKLHVSGKLLVEAADGGLLLMAPDGVLWAVQGQERIEHAQDEAPFKYLDKDSLASAITEEMPPGFRVHTTAHYVICYNTSRAYARWCGALYERLYWAFSNYWKRLGIDLHEPEQPLISLVFQDKQSYARYARAELGKATDSIIGYYSMRTNRMTMYDLTGLESIRRRGDRRGSTAQINQILSRPAAERTVATIVHEATHQLAFNCGLQTRYAPIPLWVGEGIAVYFETPDLSSRKGWRNIGGVNWVRLVRFQQYLRNRPANSLFSLMTDDTRFRDPDKALDAYAEAWALNYYLLNRRRKQYVQYLQVLSKKQPLLSDQPEQRLQDFQAVFGEDMSKLDTDFLRYMRRVR